MVFVRDGVSDVPGLNINKWSVIVSGKCRIITDDAEKMAACEALLRAQNPAASETTIKTKLEKSNLTIKGVLTWYEVTPEKVTGKVIVHKYL